jgi:hypothetical protein
MYGKWTAEFTDGCLFLDGHITLTRFTRTRYAQVWLFGQWFEFNPKTVRKGWNMRLGSYGGVRQIIYWRTKP